MVRMRCLAWVGIFLGIASSGCCWWADKWCPHQNNAPAYYQSSPICVPTPTPAYTPCVPVCPPGTTAGYQPTSWAKPVAGNPCTP